jgi:hypothetical protein
MPWRCGHHICLQDRKSRVRIPPGSKVFRNVYIAVLLSKLCALSLCVLEKNKCFFKSYTFVKFCGILPYRFFPRSNIRYYTSALSFLAECTGAFNRTFSTHFGIDPARWSSRPLFDPQIAVSDPGAEFMLMTYNFSVQLQNCEESKHNKIAK